MIWPGRLIARPGGRPAAENDSDTPPTGSAGATVRLTRFPSVPPCGPGSSSGTVAGFSRSRSVKPGSLIPLTVPELVYCQNAHRRQPGTRAGWEAVV